MSPLLGYEEIAVERARGRFEVLVRHLFDRLLASESLGDAEETPTRLTQMAYAVALPGLVVALFLDPAYHSPFGPRPYWSQVSDRFFYVTYAFVIMGLGTVLQWDLLFPDQLDTFILTSLPLDRMKLLGARVVALAAFLGLILLGSNLFGILAYPMAADLRGMGLRLTVSHGLAVFAAGICVAAFLIAVQGIFICVLGQRLTRRIAPVMQAFCVLVLLTVLFVFPLMAQFIEALLRSHSAVVEWFPPFWFLGLYEHLALGSRADPLFTTLAHTAVRATAASVALAVLTYPLAYARRLRQIVEGTGTRNAREPWKPLRWLLHRTLLREPRRRGIYHLIGETLWRTQRMRLLLAFFGGLGLAMTIASVLLIRLRHASVSFELSPYGMRLAIPIMAFWTVAGLRTAFRSPVAAAAAWMFPVIHGRPKYDHLRSAELWVALCTSCVAIAMVAVLHWLAPAALHELRITLGQMIVGVGASVLLTDVLFFTERAIPFTEARPYSVGSLPFVVITYVAFFPMFVTQVMNAEPWIEATVLHLAIATIGIVAAHTVVRRFREHLIRQDAERLDVVEEVLMPGEMGLRG